jgi:hypothetical protein
MLHPPSCLLLSAAGFWLIIFMRPALELLRKIVTYMLS